MDRDLKSCQLIASDKTNFMRKVHFPLKSGFRVLTFFILLEVGYFDTIAVFCLRMNEVIIFGILQN